MANLALRLPENVPGDFFVDSTCIDCDACRQIAPQTFSDIGATSIVQRQPADDEETKRALMALVACPTASIGTIEHHDARIGIDAFPELISENVYFCGFTAESSFGAWSYLIARPEAEGGNVLIDSPRFATQLLKRIDAMGGVRKMFLTHKDDVADHDRFAAKYHCERIMHEDDGAAHRGIETVIRGADPVQIDRDSGSGSHPRPRGSALPQQVFVHGRSSGVVTQSQFANRLSPGLLVFLGRTN
jgi:ferredoxin